MSVHNDSGAIGHRRDTITGGDGYELIKTRPGYDGWRVMGTFPYGENKERSETTVVTVEDITLSKL